MCGISGFIDYSKNLRQQQLIEANNLMNHRGPNDSGDYFDVCNNFHIGLAHKRLSIIDVSSCGHQPMHFEHLSLVFNGEIYNYQEIKLKLIEKGYAFHSTSDTEVVLKSFHAWGMDALTNFIGMFAIGLYNHNTSELFLVRDRIGVKPLYYYVDSHQLIFASELKAILSYPKVTKEFDYESLNIFLHHGYIPSPLSIFRHIHKVTPGTYIRYHKKDLTHHSYWDLKEKFSEYSQQRITDEPTALKKLDELVNDCVKYRMVADVPIGAFLSGGYDSSLVTAVMQRNTNEPVKTFTIGFNEASYNEANYARDVAEYLKTDHYEQYLHVDDALHLIDKIPTYFDEPFADSSQLPTMMVSKIAKEKVTVILSGDGGDELFCGYDRYDEAQFYWKYHKLLKPVAYANKFLPLESVLDYVDLKYKKLLHLNNLQGIVNHRYILSKYYLNGLIKNSPFTISDTFSHMLSLSRNPQEAFMLQDMLTYLPDDIMVKVDRATMSVSLEGREPLLDHRLFEFSFQLSHSLKYKNGEKKYLLKKLAHQYIPEKLLNRPKKGFSLPIHNWLKKDLNSLVEQYLSKEYINDQGIFDYHVLNFIKQQFYKEKGRGKYATTIWHLIIFQLWMNKYCVP